MKTILNILLLFSLINSSYAQTETATTKPPKVDRIIMTNGEIREGKVTAISESSIDFVFSGESLVYHIQTKNIGKIEFSSGRIQQFNPIKSEKKSENSMIKHANQVAILPFIYVKNGTQQKNDIMEQNAQKEMYKVLVDHAGPMVIQDPTKTIELLNKANINTFSIPELANILGVEYLIFNVLTINMKGTTSYSTEYGSTHYSNRNAYGYHILNNHTS